MQLAPTWLKQLPVFSRCVVLGALIGLAIGGVLGLILGLRAEPRTAWFAVLEVGIPSAAVGTVVGLLIGAVFSGAARRRSLHSPDLN